MHRAMFAISEDNIQFKAKRLYCMHTPCARQYLSGNTYNSVSLIAYCTYTKYCERSAAGKYEVLMNIQSELLKEVIQIDAIILKRFHHGFIVCHNCCWYAAEQYEQ